VQGAVEKAMREAKRNTSWISPNTAYEEATRTFVARLIDPRGPMFSKVVAFVERIAFAGMLTSLAQLVVKTTAPGVPDSFQGSELWELNLVDPDNRRPVDFGVRRRLLEGVLRLREAALARGPGPESGAQLLRELWASAEDGRIKLFVTHAMLMCRRAERELFARGGYLPLGVEGERRDNVLAFARVWQRRVVITVVGRFFTQLERDARAHLPTTESWSDTLLRLPPELAVGPLCEILTGRTVTPSGATISLGDAFAAFPIAVLVGTLQGPNDG
jgi:(1->4)-alpha-D-glucan 1-alpha-D-glucosylmutase